MLLFGAHANGQVNVKFRYSDDADKVEDVVLDSFEQLNPYLDAKVAEAFQIGYLSFSIDSIRLGDGNTQVFVFSGKLFDLERSLSSSELKALSKNLEELENSGFPFARAVIKSSLDSIGLEQVIAIDQGPFIRTDSLVLLKEEVKLNHGILARHIGFQKNSPYSEIQIRDVDRRLRSLPFLQVVRPTSVVFARDMARVLVGVDERNANQVDGIVGFQPDAEGRTVFTGEFKLGLHNAMNHLDKIDLLWQRVADNTQRLDLGLRIPYLFKSSLGVDAKMSQYRQDSTFNEVSLKAGLFTVLENGDRFEGNIESRTVNNLLNDLMAPRVSSSTIQYGILYHQVRLDDIYNPLSGRKGAIGISYGDKEVSSAEQESEPGKIGQWIARAELHKFSRLGKRSTLMIRANSYHMESDQIIFNELERIGGLKTLRGMDEQSIRASSYLVLTGEYRALTGERSFLSAFFDQGFYQYKTIDESGSDRPYGLGVGASIESGAGVLSLNYALGSQFGQALDLSTGKVHFGYSALF